MSPRVPRRRLLCGVGVTMALPLLEHDANAQESSVTSPPMRMVCVANPLGFVPDAFFPALAGKDYQATELLQDLPKDQFTVFSNLDHGVTGGHRGVHSFLSGIRNNESSEFPTRNLTVDQRAAEHVGSATRFPSIVASVGEGKGELAGQCSWTRNGINVPPIDNERALFHALFTQSDAKWRDRERDEIQRSLSVLDAVREHAQSFQKRLGHSDRTKLDEYFTSVRSVEQRLAMSAEWVSRPKPKVDFEIPNQRVDFTERLPLFYDLLKLALQTDSTRVATLAIPGTLPVGDLGLSGSYHSFSHHGQREDLRKGLLKIERFQMQQLARFLSQLNQAEQSDGKTLLDHTMVLSGSGMGNASSHSNKNLPVLLAGGGFRHGQHIVLPESSHQRVPMGNLFVSMLQRFGIESDQFNRGKSTLNGLEVA